ncbi:glycosyltransferase family 2 protein [Candidatus Microgenomates bacterium]|nr:glycosyltransferase family 2 protein [Candidatus Microgenomates bacterium]
MAKISVVINTLNEEKRLPKAISSLSGFANEIIVVDMNSTDKTVEIAKNAGAIVYNHKRMGYVEPARNFGIEKCKHNWVFVLDADEWIPKALKLYLKKQIKSYKEGITPNFFRIPRKNIIFGKWMGHTGWWPDYNIRFFKKGTVSWNEVIHSIPVTTGVGFDLPSERDLAIVHNHYSSLEEYITRMNRYTTIQAKHLKKEGVKFSWRQVISKPTSQFLTRFFAQEGYKDGLHGLSLSLLQAFSELVIYLKIWQRDKFAKRKLSIGQVEEEFDKSSKQFMWWLLESKIKKSKTLNKIWLKLKRKLKFQ